MLRIQNLVKQYAELTAVAEVSFEAEAGKVFGLLGPNGAGKSTTIHCISGLLQPTAGRVTVAGFDVVAEPRQARQALGVVPQELALYEDLPAIENLRYWGKAYGLNGAGLDDRVREVLTHIGLGDRAKDLPKTFSGGMKRRLNFGCGIVHKPQLILLDEPTVGVDPQSRERLFEMVLQERDQGACVIYTTHYMEEAEKLCDSLGIIDHGKLIAQGTLDELRAQLGARDVLQLSGKFPEAETKQAVAVLANDGLRDLEVLAADDDSMTLALSAGSHHLPRIFTAISEAGGIVTETSLKSASLETLFLTLTGKDLRQ